MDPLYKTAEDEMRERVQGAGKGMGAGKGKRVMGGGGPMSQTAQQAELKLEQMVDQRDMAVAKASVNGDAAVVEPVINQEILPISEVKLPLECGTRVDCKWRDGEFHPARVIERRPVEGTDQHEYYVHYSKFNRRMDEWVKQENLDLNTVDVGDIDGSDPKSKKRRMEDVDDEHHGEFDANELRQHEEFTKVKNVDSVELGQYQMETWYFSPLPAEYNNCKTLYFAEYDLSFFKTRGEMMRHLRKCKLQHPPGDEIYRCHYPGGRSVSMFEVDGKKEKLYCQNLCYLAKLFLDHKTLYYDVDLFLFYVLCENDERGSHIVGYFSKEKCSEEGYNLACILTLPSHQRKGYGKFLIAMSYELSKIEGKVGTPERPLSDLGNVSYRGYWTRELLKVLKEQEGSISIKELSAATMIKTEDIISTLQHLNLIQYQKGQHVICAAPAVIERHLKQAGSPGLQVDPKFIVWCPYSAEREYALYRN
ncbi:g8169 [Coccomyxa viridis]|uniref:Histone acetyltransferase n=1 Tax=Coccomyxa viridis TaxID=1274662 RepID=A0ABP1FZQ7_9CHLO